MIKQPSLACQSVTELFTELNTRPFQIFTVIALLFLATERLSRNKKKYLFINCYLLWIKQKTNKLRVQTEIPRISGNHWLGPWRNYSMDFSFFLSFQEKWSKKRKEIWWDHALMTYLRREFDGIWRQQNLVTFPRLVVCSVSLIPPAPAPPWFICSCLSAQYLVLITRLGFCLGE